MSFEIKGTHVWYYFICHRQVWLLSRHLTPDQEHESILLGKLNDQISYRRERKHLHFEGGVVDLYREDHGKLLISEVKRSSRFEESARMQLLFYLHALRERGMIASGELRIPREKKVIPVDLDQESETKLIKACEAILKIVDLEQPPSPKRTRFCKGCAYLDFCWS